MRISDWSSDVCSSDLESAPAEHHILRCVYQYRIDRSHTIADRKGDKAAVDLHRILQLLFKHLLDECADIKLGQLGVAGPEGRSEEHTSELQSLMRNSYAVFCLKKKTKRMTNYDG